MSEGDDLVLLGDADESGAAGHGPAWKLLIVDDEPEVHRVTHMVLDDFQFQGRPLRLIEAHSAREAIGLLDAHPDIALVLLDVVMESEHAGFTVVQHVRETLGNRTMRIILRTGQPGQAPARQVIQRYEINDYHSKAELTAERMYITIYTALSMYEHLRTIERREQQLQSAYAEIEQLVYIAAHDLQEPLLSVTSLSQRLLSVNREQLDANGVRCLDYIGTAVGRMSALVRDLLDYSKLGQAHPPESVDLDALVMELREDMAGHLQAARAQLDCEPLGQVQGQPTKLKMLLQNLISNALKYRHPERAPHIEIGLRRDRGQPVYWLADNGIGIAAEHHRRIFNVFQRLHEREAVPGTGIGLAHCKKIVEQHGGQIWVESEPEHGTTVFFSLPGDEA